MPLSEFALIQRYFSKQNVSNPTTRIGIGDDCALIAMPDGYELGITTDTMVENVHFFAGTDPYFLGHKLLAVNLSDLASMGAKPVSVTLALTLPKVDEAWLEAFASGFLDLAERHSVDLIGGDTTSGPLTLTVQAMGLVPRGKALLRSTALLGDFIYVTGSLGNAGLGLKIIQGYHCTNPQAAYTRFHQPDPQIDEGLALIDIANACIDVSDGLAADLGHILKESGVGAEINAAKIPRNPGATLKNALSDGEDFELLFTLSKKDGERLLRTKGHKFRFYPIGEIVGSPKKLILVDKAGKEVELPLSGWKHF